MADERTTKKWTVPTRRTQSWAIRLNQAGIDPFDGGHVGDLEAVRVAIPAWIATVAQ